MTGDPLALDALLRIAAALERLVAHQRRRDPAVTSNAAAVAVVLLGVLTLTQSVPRPGAAAARGDRVVNVAGLFTGVLTLAALEVVTSNPKPGQPSPADRLGDAGVMLSGLAKRAQAVTPKCAAGCGRSVALVGHRCGVCIRLRRTNLLDAGGTDRASRLRRWRCATCSATGVAPDHHTARTELCEHFDRRHVKAAA